MPGVVDAKIRGDRYSPTLRERKRVLQLPKDIKDKVASPYQEEKENRSVKSSK